MIVVGGFESFLNSTARSKLPVLEAKQLMAFCACSYFVSESQASLRTFKVTMPLNSRRKYQAWRQSLPVTRLVVSADRIAKLVSSSFI